MSLALHIGDWHQTVDELAEGERLAAFVLAKGQETGAKRIVLLGDQHHNHGLVHVRVQDFWLRTVAMWTTAGFEVWMMRGNHDTDGVGSAHALQAHLHQPSVTVVDRPRIENGILYLPYYDNETEFLAQCEFHRTAHVVVCHQTFKGCLYENGIYAPDGFDLDKVPQPKVISGHIHRPQQFGKLWYPGAPRWRSASDANTARYVYLVDEALLSNSAYLYSDKFDTAEACSALLQYEVTPETALPEIPQGLARHLFDVRGPRAFIERTVKELKESFPKARVRTFPTDGAAISVKESEGIATAFEKYLGAFKPPFGTDLQLLASMARDRLHGI